VLRYLADFKAGQSFDEGQEERGTELRARHFELEQSYDDTLEALGTALSMKDSEIEGHCQRVTAFTISIAKAVPVPDTIDATRPPWDHSPHSHAAGRRRSLVLSTSAPTSR